MRYTRTRTRTHRCEETETHKLTQISQATSVCVNVPLATSQFACISICEGISITRTLTNSLAYTSSKEATVCARCIKNQRVIFLFECLVLSSRSVSHYEAILVGTNKHSTREFSFFYEIFDLKSNQIKS